MSDPTSITTPGGTNTPGQQNFIPNGRSVSAGNGWTWIADGFSIFAKGWLMWILFTIVLFVVSIAFALVPIVGQLAFNIILPLIGASIVIGCKAIEDGEELKIEHMVAGFSSKPGPLVVVGLLYLLATLIIVAIFIAIVGASIGTVIIMHPEQIDAALIAGVIVSVVIAALVMLGLAVPVAMAFWFAVPLVVFHDIAPTAAIKMSFFGCLKNIVPFLVYGIVMFVLLIIAALPIGLGLLVMVPVLFTSAYRSYRDIFTLTD